MKRLFVIGFIFLFLIPTIPIVSAKTKTITDSTGDVYHVYEVNYSRYFKIVERPNLDITEFSYSIESGYLEMQLKIAGEILTTNNTQYLMVFYSRSNRLFSLLDIDIYEFSYQNGIIIEESPTKLIDYEIENNFIRCRFDFKKNQDSFYWFGFGGTIEHSDGEYIDQCPNFGPPFSIPVVVTEGFFGRFGKDLKIIFSNSFNQTLNISIDIFTKGLFDLSYSKNEPIKITVEPKSYIAQNINEKIQKPFIGTTCFYAKVEDSDVSSFTEYFSIGQFYFLRKMWFKLTCGEEIRIFDSPKITGFFNKRVDIDSPKIKSHFMKYLIEVT
ncbi:MAG: hypothetical protein JXA91_05485 [Candidatus Thermoplasmatota archaeon]|nr:hypothetical protein [Candidatus Thermoplasmatota archaeon]